MAPSAEAEAERQRRERTERQLRQLGSNPANNVAMDARKQLAAPTAEDKPVVSIPGHTDRSADDMLAELDAPLNGTEARAAETAGTSSLPGSTNAPRSVTFEPTLPSKPSQPGSGAQRKRQAPKLKAIGAGVRLYDSSHHTSHHITQVRVHALNARATSADMRSFPFSGPCRTQQRQMGR